MRIPRSGLRLLRQDQLLAQVLGMLFGLLEPGCGIHCLPPRPIAGVGRNDLQVRDTLFCDLEPAVLDMALLQQLSALGVDFGALWRCKVLIHDTTEFQLEVELVDEICGVDPCRK